jgi:hypothetical protein
MIKAAFFSLTFLKWSGMYALSLAAVFVPFAVCVAACRRDVSLTQSVVMQAVIVGYIAKDWASL